MNKWIGSEKGSSFATLLIVIVVLVVLGTSLLGVSLTEANQAIHQENTTQAHYVARSGAEIIAKAITTDQSTTYLNGLIGSTFTGNINGNAYSVFVEDMFGTKKTLKLHASGTVNGVTQNVSLIVSKEGNFFLHAIFGDEILNLGGSSNTTVYGGDVATNASTYTGSITFVPSGNQVITNADFDLDPIDVAVYNDPNPHTIINRIDTNYDINLAALPTYKTNAAGDPVVLVKVDEVNLSGNRKIRVIGPGELHILVQNSFSMSGSSGIETVNDDTSVYIDYNGTSTFTFNGNVNMAGYIYAPNSTILVNGGGMGTLVGSMTANAVHFNGGTLSITFNEDLSTDTIDVSFRKLQWSY